MAEKEKVKLNAYINRHLADEFRQVARLSYGQIGLCLSAAMLQFLETAPEEQITHIKRVFDAEEDGTIERLIAEVKQKHRAGRDPKRK